MSKTSKPNPVAKYARRVNRHSVHADQKKANKKGYRKHKRQAYEQSIFMSVLFISLTIKSAFQNCY